MNYCLFFFLNKQRKVTNIVNKSKQSEQSKEGEIRRKDGLWDVIMSLNVAQWKLDSGHPPLHILTQVNTCQSVF